MAATTRLATKKALVHLAEEGTVTGQSNASYIGYTFLDRYELKYPFLNSLLIGRLVPFIIFCIS